MHNIRKHLNYFTIILFSATLLLVLISVCYAQTHHGSYTHAPEPGSLVLLSSTGFLGWLVSFARRRFREFKRLFDIGAGAFGLVIFSPVVLSAAILIKLVSPGPAFFRQERVGYRGRIFDIYKLRTMRVGAEKKTGPVWAEEDDPRLIKYGKIIRKLHIDEFPQFFNVLKGEMSIIGPRPERPFFVKGLSRKISEYRKRLGVKPGITGLAQVRHKYDETIQDVKKKIKYDLLYIRRMCLLVDLRILVWTIIVAITGKGAR